MLISCTGELDNAVDQRAGKCTETGRGDGRRAASFLRVPGHGHCAPRYDLESMVAIFVAKMHLKVIVSVLGVYILIPFEDILLSYLSARISRLTYSTPTPHR